MKNIKVFLTLRILLSTVVFISIPKNIVVQHAEDHPT